MELFIEVSGPVGCGKTHLLNVIKNALEKEGYVLNWRHQSFEAGSYEVRPPGQQVFANVSSVKRDANG